MISFGLGYAIVFGAACVVALVADKTSITGAIFWGEPIQWHDLAVRLFVIPVVAASLAIECLDRAWPRRWLDIRVRRGGMLLLAGIGSATLALVVLSVILVWLEDVAPGWMLVPGCTLLATGAAFVLMPRVRGGQCIQCGYDVSDGAAGGRCPECGTLDP